MSCHLQLEFTGVSGWVKFDKNGFRDKFTLNLFDITMTMGLAEVRYILLLVLVSWKCIYRTTWSVPRDVHNFEFTLISSCVRAHQFLLGLYYVCTLLCTHTYVENMVSLDELTGMQRFVTLCQYSLDP